MSRKRRNGGSGRRAETVHDATEDRGVHHAAPRRSRAWVIASAIPVAIGVALAVRGAWVCDDAFISFRYIDQWERGNGLVYNPGERVEGYTHFLWLALLAALHRVGFDLVTLGRHLPIVFFAATLTVLLVRSLRRPGPWWLSLPVAAWGVALHQDLQAFASSGLETAAFTLCVLLAFLAASASRLRPERVAVATALATLFRPEGLLVTGIVVLFLFRRRCGLAALRSFAAVWMALVLPLFVWRWIYYRDLLPNTFYAKSVGVANWSQGGRYAFLYFAIYPVLAVGLVVTIAGALRAVRRRGAEPILLAAMLVLAMLLYVVHIGGDFMFARFLLPVTPLLYVGLEDALRGQRRGIAVTGAALVVATTVLSQIPHGRIFPERTRVHGIVNEHHFYERDFVDMRRRQGEQLAQALAGVPARFCILGGQASLAYFGRLPYVLERYGLTDRELARRRLGGRGRPGHERVASGADMLARRVHFRFHAATDSIKPALDEVQLGELHLQLIVYERAVMDQLRGRPGVVFVDYPEQLDRILTQAHDLDPQTRRRLWEFFKSRYFDFNHDPERLARATAAFSGTEAQGQSRH